MRSERLSYSSEIKRRLYHLMEGCKAGGPILYYERGSKYAHIEEDHTLIVGMSGAGKTRGCILPMIASFIKAGESYIVVDPKKEIYGNTHHLIGKQYETWIIDFRDLLRSKGWNPLRLLYVLYKSGDKYNRQLATEKIKELAQILYPNNMEGQFWVLSARSLFQGVVHALFEFGREEEINIASIHKMVAEADEKMGMGRTYLKELMIHLPEDSAASMFLQSYVSCTAGETRSGIRSVFFEGLSSMILGDGLKEFLAQNDLDIHHLDGKKPLAMYIVIPDENSVYESLAGILISQLMTHFVWLAQNRYDGRLPNRLNICLEELGNIAKSIPDLDHIMTAGRSRNIRLQLVLQSLSQLNDAYGVSKADTITSNAGVVVAFRTNHWGTLEELSRKLGEREKFTESQLDKEALITPAQLGAMETRQALIMIQGRIKYVVKLPDYEEMFDCRNIAIPKKAEICLRKKPQVFLIKDYLWNLKEKECEDEEDDAPYYYPPYKFDRDRN